MTSPQVKSSKPPKLPTQVTNKDEKIFEKEEHKLIYETFLGILKNPEGQTQQEIEEKKQKLEEKPSEQETQKLQSDLESLGKQLKQLKQLKELNNEDEKKIFTFVCENSGKIFKNVNPEVKPLSEENFYQFLFSVLKEIREQGLAREEKLNNDKIQQIITKCVADIRGTEAKDSLIKLAGWPLGVKVDPKNFLGSFKDGLLEKVPFFGKDKKEEDEPPLSDEEMVTTFLRKSLLPVILFSLTTLIFGTGPIMLSIAVVGLLITEAKVIKSLFSNDKKGTLYNPHSQDEKKEWGDKIRDDIIDILKTPIKEVGENNQPTVIAEEQLTQKSKQSTVLEQISQVRNEESKQSTVLEQVTSAQQAKNTGEQPSKTK